MKNLKKLIVLGSMFIGSAIAQDLEQELDLPFTNLDQIMYQAADYIDQQQSFQKAYGNGIYFLSYPASGATAVRSTTEYLPAGSNCVYKVSSGSSYFDMPLQIPPGHAIVGFRYYWYDLSNTAHSTATLLKFDGSGGFSNLLEVQSTDTTGYGSRLGYVRDGSNNLAPHTVNYSNGSYVIRFGSSPSAIGTPIQMCGVVLFINSTP